VRYGLRALRLADTDVEIVAQLVGMMCGDDGAGLAQAAAQGVDVARGEVGGFGAVDTVGAYALANVQARSVAARAARVRGRGRPVIVTRRKVASDAERRPSDAFVRGVASPLSRAAAESE
jgi:hypothetical protein